jgi:hypothetical protein
MSEADRIYWDMQSVIERWLDAYPSSVFPDEVDAVRLARHILQSLSLELEAIHIDHRAQREDKQAMQATLEAYRKETQG